MKTVGERIRQARTALGWSGLDLALKAGYKSQSGISNLENRVGGTGGGKIAKVAKILKVPVEWLISGPDSDTVPFIPEQVLSPCNVTPITANDNASTSPYLWPFKRVSAKAYAMLTQEEKDHIENSVLIIVNARADPEKQDVPAKYTASS